MLVVKKDENTDTVLPKSPGIRDAQETALSSPPNGAMGGQTRVFSDWCAMCIDFAGPTPRIIMEHARAKIIGGLLLQTRVRSQAKLGPQPYFLTAPVRMEYPISTNASPHLDVHHHIKSLLYVNTGLLEDMRYTISES